MIELWELKGKGDRRYSLFSWRTRLALKHKGLDFTSHPVAAFMSQSAKPALHEIWHIDFAHEGLPFTLLHALPQRCVTASQPSPVHTGHFRLTFTEKSPHSDTAAIAKRIGRQHARTTGIGNDGKP